jgi:hypothetical protein
MHLLCDKVMHPIDYDGSDPNGIRTRVTAVKGRCPRPLDDRVSERQISRRRQGLQAAFVADQRDQTQKLIVAGSKKVFR